MLFLRSQVSMDADGHRFSTSPSCWIRLHPPVNQLLLQISEVHVISPEVHVTQICSDSLPARLGASALQTSRSFQQDPLNMLQTRLTHLKPVSHSLIQTETLTVWPDEAMKSSVQDSFSGVFPVHFCAFKHVVFSCLSWFSRAFDPGSRSCFLSGRTVCKSAAHQGHAAHFKAARLIVFPAPRG